MITVPAKGLPPPDSRGIGRSPLPQVVTELVTGAGGADGQTLKPDRGERRRRRIQFPAARSLGDLAVPRPGRRGLSGFSARQAGSRLPATPRAHRAPRRRGCARGAERNGYGHLCQGGENYMILVG